MSTNKVLIIAAACAALAGPAWAQKGPVGAACKADIQKFCADKSHGAGAVRDCLEANKAKVTAACKTALDTTGRGRRRKQQ